MPERKHDEIIASHFAKKFFARFAAAPHHIFRAPGRVNLIGEHTDYNDGFVLPAATALCTWTAIAPRKDHELHVFSGNLNETAKLDLTETHPQPQHRWSDYIHGVALMLQRLAVPVAGANIFIASDIPSGAGLSSSAALEVSVASALLSNSGRTLDLVEIAKLCQRAENEFVGARVGIMDLRITPSCWIAVRWNSSDCHCLRAWPWWSAIPWSSTGMRAANTISGAHNAKKAWRCYGVTFLRLKRCAA